MKLRLRLGLLAAVTLATLLLIWSPWRDRHKEEYELFLSLCDRYDSEVSVGMHQDEVTRRFGQPISACRPMFRDTHMPEGSPAIRNPPYPGGVMIVGWKIHEDYDFELEISDSGCVTRKYSSIHDIHHPRKSLLERLRSIFE